MPLSTCKSAFICVAIVLGCTTVASAEPKLGTALLAERSVMTVRFASDGYDRVSLVLAESQLRVRLADDVQLRCEISSRDLENTDAEITFDLGVQFRFK